MLTILLALTLACSPKPVPPQAAVTDTVAPHVHTVEELRAGLPVGTRIRLSIVVVGRPPVEQRWHFVACDAAGATIASQTHSAEGVLLQEEGEGTSSWTELHAHADFPAAATARTESSVDVPAGHFETWLYTVQKVAADGSPEVHRYHFAKSSPGPPVLYTAEQGGIETLRMTMLERTTP